MKCYKKAENGTALLNCTAEEEALCRAFLKKYKVRYRSATEGIYGGSQEVVLSEFVKDYTDDSLTCILEEGEVVGCYLQSFRFLLRGMREHSQGSGPSSQGPLIWDRETWTLTER